MWPRKWGLPLAPPPSLRLRFPRFRGQTRAPSPTLRMLSSRKYSQEDPPPFPHPAPLACREGNYPRWEYWGPCHPNSNPMRWLIAWWLHATSDKPRTQGLPQLPSPVHTGAGEGGVYHSGKSGCLIPSVMRQRSRSAQGKAGRKDEQPAPLRWALYEQDGNSILQRAVKSNGGPGGN